MTQQNSSFNIQKPAKATKVQKKIKTSKNAVQSAEDEDFFLQSSDSEVESILSGLTSRISSRSYDSDESFGNYYS